MKTRKVFGNRFEPVVGRCVYRQEREPNGVTAVSYTHLLYRQRVNYLAVVVCLDAGDGVRLFVIAAQLGSDYKKPDAITRIEADNYRQIVYPLPVEEMCIRDSCDSIRFAFLTVNAPPYNWFETVAENFPGLHLVMSCVCASSFYAVAFDAQDGQISWTERCV